MAGANMKKITYFLMISCLLMPSLSAAIKPHLNAVVTFETKDENFAVSGSLISALVDRVPVFCNPRMFWRAIKEFPFSSKNLKDFEKKLVQVNESSWSVFSDKERNWVVLLPYQYNDKLLEQHGLNGKVLEHIPPGTVFDTIYQEKSFRDRDHLINSFKTLFIQWWNERFPKRFLLIGHGFINLIASLTGSAFMELLNFLNALDTEFLYVATCYGGGVNLVDMQNRINAELENQLSLRRLSERQREKMYVKAQERPQWIDYFHTSSRKNTKNLSPLILGVMGSKMRRIKTNRVIDYPIVIQATTDEATKSVVGIDHFFQLLDRYLAQSQWYLGRPSPKKGDRTTIKDVVTALYSGEIHALASVRFPGANNFFRAIKVTQMDILTWTYIQSLKLAPKIKMIQLARLLQITLERPDRKPFKEVKEFFDDKFGIYVMQRHKTDQEIEALRLEQKKLKDTSKDISNVNLEQPLVLVYCSDLNGLKFTVSAHNPLFISKIAGNSQHFFESVHLKGWKSPPSVFIPDFGKNKFGLYSKAWFISKLQKGAHLSVESAEWSRGKRGVIIYKTGSDIEFPKFLMISKDEDKARIGSLEESEVKYVPADVNTLHEFDPNAYYWMATALFNATRADESNLREATAGHENFETEQDAFDYFKESIGLVRPEGNLGLENAIKFAIKHKLFALLSELHKLSTEAARDIFSERIRLEKNRKQAEIEKEKKVLLSPKEVEELEKRYTKIAQKSLDELNRQRDKLVQELIGLKLAIASQERAHKPSKAELKKVKTTETMLKIIDKISNQYMPKAQDEVWDD